LIVCQENCTGIKPILEDVDPDAEDPIRALAAKYFNIPCAVMTRNTRRLDNLRRFAAEYRPECIVEIIWQTCVTYDIESYQIRRLTEQELNIPYLRIETDYSPSDSARIAVRVEALYETVRAGQRG
jgi:benzoyl-CoA reductase/2-hydroxyglutaryl-CoA dehydratase subunit BcrC/BadD/HgdB